MTKFNVGDRVSVNNHMFVLSDNQRRGTIVGISHTQYRVKLDNYGTYTSGILTFSAPQLSRTCEESATDRRLTEAEAKIASLESKVAALETVLADKSKLSHAPSVDEMMRLGKSVTRTPNQRRADVIKRAQAFANEGYDRWIGDSLCYVEFFVNSDKRTAVAVLRGKYSSGLITKGIAKCAPDDVFNADIGKAIALGRALGVKVPTEFTDAVKPTEVVVGMRVENTEDSYWGGGKVASLEREDCAGSRGYSVESGSYNYLKTAVIIDDTDAVYP